MDTFAAIALSTEPPLPSVLQGQNGSGKILTGAVWRQILGISLWNALVMAVVIIFGPSIAGISSAQSPLTNEDAHKKLVTLIFNCFVFLQLFNEINCRKVGRRDFNVFEKFFHNMYYIIILFTCFGFQYVLSEYLSGIAGTTHLTKSEWGGCIAIGSTVLFVSLLLKLTPESLVNKFDR